MVDLETKSALIDMVMEGYLTIKRNENGEVAFVMTDEGRTAIEQWLLEERHDAD
tara:strand:- start:189 stop:350 length:162 start_codon:yes stop_codon:yes gene_type:complete